MNTRSIFQKDTVPFAFYLATLLAVTLLGDAALHALGLASIGRWLGIPGLVLIGLSLVYSARKRHLIKRGSPSKYLRFHEYAAWLGSAMVLLHSGIHFGAVLPWFATLAMVTTVTSGLVGKYLLRRARETSRGRMDALKAIGDKSPEEIEQMLFSDAVAIEYMSRWRSIHFPITAASTILTVGHLVSTFLFWGWR
jgi:cation transport ATPase